MPPHTKDGALTLSLDTCTSVASVALLDGKGDTLWYETILRSASSRRPSSWLSGAIDSGLRLLGASVEDVDRVVVTVGPGSFTGARLALSVAKGLALARPEMELVGISSLAALAWPLLSSRGGYVAATMDARRGEVYYALFHQERGTLVAPSVGPPLRAASEVLTAVGVLSDLVLVGEGADVLLAALNERSAAGGSSTGKASRAPTWFDALRASAAAVAAHAFGRLLDPRDGEPIYVRKPEAERMLSG